MGLVSPTQFLRSAREAGYRSPAHAISELIDNSIDAQATRIKLNVSQNGTGWDVTVEDNGVGMSEATLGRALQFGGSHLLDERPGRIGRFGVGLPLGGLSLARRIEICSHDGVVSSQCWLDLDEFASGQRKTLPRVERSFYRPTESATGTVVRLIGCDRMGSRQYPSLVANLRRDLGRIHRFSLWSGISIEIGGVAVSAWDPLLIRSECKIALGYGEQISIPVRTVGRADSNVQVRFSLLDVERWSVASTSEKRKLGITAAPQVSVVRGNREIDAGWFFLGSKRRQNYDNWWRAEVRFTRDVDSLFGLTFNKQGIRPEAEFAQQISLFVEPVASELTAEIRRRFQRNPKPAERKSLDNAERLLPSTNKGRGKAPVPTAKCRVSGAASNDRSFYQVDNRSGVPLVTLNTRHAFYSEVYRQASKSGVDRLVMDRLLLSLARATTLNQSGKQVVEIESWSDSLQAYLKA